MEPMSLVEGNLIAQNILINAYERPLTAVEIARSLGIPTAYIEPTIDKLVDGELMVKTEGDRYYTDCIVFKPEDSLTRFDAQLKFVDDNIESFWNILRKMLDRTLTLEFCERLNHRQLKKLERYAIQCAVQDFIADGAQELYIINTEYPKRKDGGRWIAQANMFPADFDDSKMNLYNEYAYVGGHRSCGRDEEYMGSHGLAMFEFETAFKDCGNAKWSIIGFRKYIGYMRKLMWCIYKGIPLDTAGTNIPADMIERLPKYEEYGILLHECGSWKVDIPTLSSDEYRSDLIPIIDEAKDALISELGEKYVEFLRGTKIILPEHLKGSPNVPDYRLYVCSNKCILMAVVRELAEKKLFLHDVDYCCPAMVFIFDE